MQCGFGGSARQGVAAALKQGSNPFLESTAAIAYAFLGDADRANAIIDALSTRYPSNALLKLEAVLPIRALNLLHAKRADEAVAALEPSRKYEWAAPESPITYLSIYVRGMAYLQVRDGAKAAAEFQKILDHPGLNPLGVLYALAQLNLARAYAVQNKTDQARIAYQNFLAEWKDADPDIPVLIAAKSEYAKLH